MNLPTTRPLSIAAAVLAVGVPATAAVALIGSTGGDDTPSLRAQFGGHGGRPAAFTGPAGRVALDGDWTVASDRDGSGAARGFSRGRFAGRRVKLPYVPNAREVTGRRGEVAHEGSIAWYRTTLKVPEDGRYALRFESVNHEAIVWLDGRRVARHVGTYLPFEARAELDAGKTHTLVVRADYRDPLAMKAAGWHRTWFNFGGINREVTIRRLGPVDVLAPSVRTVLQPGGAARVDVTARVRSTAPSGTKDLTGTLKEGETEIPVRFDAGVPAGATRTVRASVTIPEPRLWSQERPVLHDLELRAGGKAVWRGRVGLRELRREGGTILLNGRPVVLRGASLHEEVPGRGDGLRPEDEDRLVADLEGLGANATRAQHPLSPSLLERLDAAGLLVWMGIGPVDAPGAWTSKGPRLQRQARDRVRATVDQLQTHPSVLAWNLANEAAGDGHPDGQIPYVRAMARELHERDPGRLVALDVWGAHRPKAAYPMYEDVDAIGWTNYLGWYEEPFATQEQVAAAIRSELADLRRIFPDKAIAVTEFGAEGDERNPAGEHGGLDFQARLLRTHLETYRSIPGLAGALVWNLRDFAVAPSFGGGSIVELVPDIKLVRGLNEKGVLDYDGRPKPAAGVVRDELRAWAREAG